MDARAKLVPELRSAHLREVGEAPGASPAATEVTGNWVVQAAFVDALNEVGEVAAWDRHEGKPASSEVRCGEDDGWPRDHHRRQFPVGASPWVPHVCESVG